MANPPYYFCSSFELIILLNGTQSNHFMVNYDGAPVYTAHAGKLIYASGNRIAIFDATKNVTYLYLHFEVKAGQNSTASMPSTNLTTPLPSLSPYNYV